MFGTNSHLDWSLKSTNKDNKMTFELALELIRQYVAGGPIDPVEFRAALTHILEVYEVEAK